MGKSGIDVTHPEVCKQWSAHNINDYPCNYTYGSNTKVWWDCEVCSNSYQQRIASKIIVGQGCPFCSGRYPTKETSLLIRFPDLIKEWDFEKNKCDPETYAPGSHYKAHWICSVSDCRRQYQTIIKNRTISGNGCPYCSGRKVNDKNSLQVNFKDISLEWDCEKNEGILPEAVTYGTDKKYWWKCQNKHCQMSYLTSPNSRTSNNQGCPYCSNQKACEWNCLATRFPEVAAEWDYEKNKLTPQQIIPGSNKRYFWICPKMNCGKKYSAVVSYRTKDGAGCPLCRKSPGVIKIINWLEKENIMFGLEHRFPTCKYKNTLPFDFYLPDKNLCIEYDGEHHFENSRWYKNGGQGHMREDFIEVSCRDKIKNAYCDNNSIKLLRIPYWEVENIETILKNELNEVM